MLMTQENDDIWGMQEGNTEDLPLENPAVQPPAAEDMEAEQESPVRQPAPASRKKGMSLATKIMLGVGLFFIVLGGGFIALLLTGSTEEPPMLEKRAQPSASSPFPHESPVTSATSEPASMLESQASQPVPSPEHASFLEKGRAPAISEPNKGQAAASEVFQTRKHVEELEKLETQIEEMNTLMTGLRGEAQKLAAAMRGEGMAAITEDALKQLMATNAEQLAQLDQLYLDIARLQEENKKLNSENQLLNKTINKLEQENAKLSYTINKKSPSKVQISPARSPSSSKRSSSAEKRVDISKFELQGLTDNFAVIKFDSEYKMWNVGEEIGGVTLKTINIKQGSILTTHGTIKMKK